MTRVTPFGFIISLAIAAVCVWRAEHVYEAGTSAAWLWYGGGAFFFVLGLMSKNWLPRLDV